MTARSINEVLSGITPKARRTFQPVRRNSYNVGEREAKWWRPICRREIGPRMQAAEFYNRSRKEPGKRNGPLGHVGLEVLRELYRLVDHKTGRLEPAIDTLMKALRRSRDAVVRALAALKNHGFLDWLRRTEPTDNDGQGPQVRQISNAYRFGLPQAAQAFVARILGKGPPPDDDAQRRQEAAAELARMIEGLPLPERMRAQINDPELADILSRLGSHLEDDASPPSGQNPASEI